MELSKQTIIDALETIDVKNNKKFVKDAFSCALNRFLLSNLEDKYDIRELFSSAIIQVASSKMVLM